MPTTTFLKAGYVCIRCGHEWIARKPRLKRAKRKGVVSGDPTKPRLCPKCKTPFWDVAKAPSW